LSALAAGASTGSAAAALQPVRSLSDLTPAPPANAPATYLAPIKAQVCKPPARARPKKGGAAKALAAARRLPLAAVDHLHGHVAATFLAPQRFDPPFLCLVASGGHTLLADVRERGSFEVLGRTLDDAAGEAFDKGARMLGLPYPGGPALEDLAASGDSAAFDFPTAEGVPGLDFSFAGIKTALLYRIRDLGEGEAQRRRADLAASYQRAIVESLAVRVERALVQTGHERLTIGGGVAANGALRERVAGLAAAVAIPPGELCTDNAAMIAAAAREVQPLAFPDYLGLDVYATGERNL